VPGQRSHSFYFSPGAAAPGAVASAPSDPSADVTVLQQRLKKLEDEAKRREAAASTATPPTTESLPPATPKSTAAPPSKPGAHKISPQPIRIGAPLSRKEPGFNIYEGFAVTGTQLRMGPATSLAACQALCRDTPGCGAATYSNFFLVRMYPASSTATSPIP
jgi:hypothetical protein